jgi:hypothetical protein
MVCTRLYDMADDDDYILCNHHHQPINAPTAGAFLMDHPQGERSPPRRPSAGWWVLTTANTAGSRY